LNKNVTGELDNIDKKTKFIKSWITSGCLDQFALNGYRSHFHPLLTGR